MSDDGRNASMLDVKRWARWSLLLASLLIGCQALFGEVEVTRSGRSSSIDCVAGELRCNGEYLLNCGSKETGWMLKETCASEVLCDAKLERCALCRDGDFRCDGANRQRCASNGATWKTIEACGDENLCSESSCGTCPTEGALDCSLGSKLRECRGGVWVGLDNCVSSAVCNATIAQAMSAGDAWDHKCAAAGCSPPHSYRCDGTTLQRCPSDQSAWATVDTCASVALCAATVADVNSANAGGATESDATADSNASAVVDMCKPGCPAAGAFFCAGTTLQKCSADQVSYENVTVCEANTECDPVAGVCGQLCTPGHYQCNGAALRKCEASGHWKDQDACETAELCSVSADGAEGHCTLSPCGAAAYKCSGVSLQKCKKDRTGYQEVESCKSAALCDAKSQRCTEPSCDVPDGYRCFGQDLKQCATDLTQWKDVKTCPAGQYCDSTSAGCLTSCPANPIRCNGKVLEQCSAAKGWATKATCATADLCACTQTSPPSCSKGVFKDGCGTVACTANTFQCSGTDLQKCQAGQNGWDTTAACGKYAYDGNPSLCYAGTGPAYLDGYCLTCPVAGALACNLGNGVLQVCSSDRRNWSNKNPTACQNGCVAVPSSDDYCAVCQSGAVRCSGATLETCPANAKAWNQQACASAALCDAAHSQCDECNQTTCSGTTLQVCSADGQKHTDSTCATAALCNAAKSQCDAPVCNVGQYQCAGAELQVCNAARTGYVLSNKCASAGLCDATAKACKPKVCNTGDMQCNGALLQTCNVDFTAYATTQTCASATLCNSKTLKCDPIVCKAGDKQCSGAVPQTCKADLSGWASGTTCGAVGCTAGVCNACIAGQHQCSVKGNSQKCSTDLSGFVDETVCGAAGCNSTTGLCNTCAVGQKKCKGTNLQVCNAAQSDFVDGTDCGTPGCNATTNTCNAPVCTAGSFNCDGLEHQTCDVLANAWATDETCVLSCSKTTGCKNCDATSVPSCVGNSLVTCNASGHWVTTDCADNVCNPLGSCDPPVSPPPPTPPAP